MSRISQAVFSVQEAIFSQDCCSTTSPSIGARTTVSRPPSPTRKTPPHANQASRVVIRRSSRKRISIPNKPSVKTISPRQYGLGPADSWAGLWVKAGRFCALSGERPCGRSKIVDTAACRRRGFAGTGADESKRTKTVAGIIAPLPGEIPRAGPGLGRAALQTLSPGSSRIWVMRRSLRSGVE